MLTLYILNVGHGDTIAIKFPNNQWGVIDCNRNAGETEPNILKFLTGVGVKELEFVCITHPHDDHFKGIDRLIEHYRDTIKAVWLYGIRIGSKAEQNENLSLYKALKICANIKRQRQENIVKVLKRGQVFSIDEVEINILNPTDKILEDLSLSSYDTDQPYNNSSVIMHLKYKDRIILLGADATVDNWNEVIDVFTDLKQKNKLLSNVLKVSHHGSIDNNTKPILTDITRKDDNISIISTDGGKRYKSLPSQDVIDFLSSKRKTKVYKTSDLILKEIEQVNVPDLGQNEIINAGLSLFTNPMKTTAYDGMIKVTIDENGNIEEKSINSIQEEIERILQNN